ncbi:hypothetical protein [Chenggangzhangella methanolivorans]|uniref:Uncharacterized protein n=1 Tax=Chenggangzhangella methanolivorans TaxID=1437009 RepID=A0A9E6RCD9_9HYPH|nr:hypothetical protein [Chenggangzhangella methanolivorans]QZO01662.1 hypothetical protein K6K41_09830 [Chenggangzhangella methanolivorans]
MTTIDRPPPLDRADAPVFDHAQRPPQDFWDQPVADNDNEPRRSGRSIGERLTAEEEFVLATKIRIADAATQSDRPTTLSWPVERMLRLGGYERALRVAQAYKRTWDVVAANFQLFGSALDDADMYSIAQRTWRDPASGEVRYKGVQQPKSADRGDGCYQVIGGRSKPTPKAWRGDEPLHRRMDAQRLLCAAQALAGPLCQPLEFAVCFGATLGAVGEREGFSGKAAEAVGKAFVLRGLAAVAPLFPCADNDNGELYAAA